MWFGNSGDEIIFFWGFLFFFLFFSPFFFFKVLQMGFDQFGGVVADFGIESRERERNDKV